MKTNFQSGEVLTASDLNSNFTECASKADSATTYTKTEVNTALAGKADADKIYKSDSLYIKVEESQSTHDHDKVKLQASAVGGDAVTEDISTIADSSNPFSATRRKIVASGAIKDALDSKADISMIRDINEINIESSTTVDVSQKVDGKLYELKNLGGRVLNTILTCPSGHRIHYHQNGGTTTNNCIIIRAYKFQQTHYAIEIVFSLNI